MSNLDRLQMISRTLFLASQLLSSQKNLSSRLTMHFMRKSAQKRVSVDMWNSRPKLRISSQFFQLTRLQICCSQTVFSLQTQRQSAIQNSYIQLYRPISTGTTTFSRSRQFRVISNMTRLLEFRWSLASFLPSWKLPENKLRKKGLARARAALLVFNRKESLIRSAESLQVCSLFVSRKLLNSSSLRGITVGIRFFFLIKEEVKMFYSFLMSSCLSTSQQSSWFSGISIPQSTRICSGTVPQPLQICETRLYNASELSLPSMFLSSYSTKFSCLRPFTNSPRCRQNSWPSLVFTTMSARLFSLTNSAIFLEQMLAGTCSLDFSSKQLMQCRSLQYSPLNPPNMSMQLPTKQAECRRLALGSSPAILSAFIVFFSLSITSISLRSLLNLPPNMQILLSQTVDVWPHLVRNAAPEGRRSLHSSRSMSPSLSRGVMSREQTSLRHRYLAQQPPITKNQLPIMAEEWNLLAQGLGLDLSMGSSFQLLVSKLNTHRSSMSVMPSPPNTIRQGYSNSAQWQVLSQGEGSFSLAGISDHSLVIQLSTLMELNLFLLAPPPPKMTILSFSESQLMEQLDLCEGVSPVVLISVHSMVVVLNDQTSFMQTDSAQPPKQTTSLPITQQLWPHRGRGMLLDCRFSCALCHVCLSMICSCFRI